MGNVNKSKLTKISEKSQRNKHGINVLRIKGLNPRSAKSKDSRTDSNQYLQAFKPSNTNISVSQNICFAATDLPDIPPLEKTVQDEIHRLKENSHKHSLPSKKRISGKLNPFMAFRAYHSRDVTKSSDQRAISGMLAKCWSEDIPTQMIWKRKGLMELPEEKGSALDNQSRKTLSNKINKNDGRVENIFLGDLPELSGLVQSGQFSKSDQDKDSNLLLEYDPFPFQELMFDSPIMDDKGGSQFPVDPALDNSR
ncbi:hypothetical protein WICPIJ_004996 [Wickerhamomyces pijperi]|uniref:Alpha box domain-containing protein n=1 Tax=Wickerhamomyces pijperi TaxID=599730 RepID=A0A9P8Q6Y7_WICPI|nr:hypothetical protein WICPIJ_004996 [Wickerhamomyces pijperi]